MRPPLVDRTLRDQGNRIPHPGEAGSPDRRKKAEESDVEKEQWRMHT